MTEAKKPDDLLDRISGAVSGAEAEEEPSSGRRRNGDPDPESLEGRLRLLVPTHTFWHVEKGKVPDAVRALVDVLGTRLGSRGKVKVPEIPDKISAVWTTPEGIWHIQFADCPEGGSHISIDGPETDVTREHVTTEDALTLCHAVGAVGSTARPGDLHD